jgi:phosphopentomutase
MRVIWIVLDGVGLEAQPDASDYGDALAATLPHVASACGGLHVPNLQELGLGHLAKIAGVPACDNPLSAYARLAENSRGKDSIVGHWELSGLQIKKPFSVFPSGFPESLIRDFTELHGEPPLGNVAAGGVSILKSFGEEHLKTKRPIVYTSVDSVFQIAAHEEILTPEELYKLCRSAKKITDKYNIARVIARPFLGDLKTGFKRTPRRKDFTMPPPEPTVLEHLIKEGHKVIAIGKISDLFAGKGISRSLPTLDNQHGMETILRELKVFDAGLIFANLIDFDMVFGHRRDAIGFGRALEHFDAWLPRLFSIMELQDVVVICADHGCDPTTPGTDHTREYVPALLWSKSLKKGIALGDRQSFADIGATIADLFGIEHQLDGHSFFEQLDLVTRPSF